ncbi:hypothetical protein [Streptomyces sp. CNQ085]|uniref:hypothetical protein n=1 Tax=Streptomyces sp. CNQ085 TaxID=2886944 RepID=UPI001F510E9C|nr:hypothetical protein [Streptomyces sp. CNQ085]MCI0386183.1 hypothetical protein [Streptomyces sp. CNQ085]
MTDQTEPQTPLCPAHHTTVGNFCPACSRDFFALLGANGLVHTPAPGVLDDRDRPLPVGPTCDSMNHNSVGDEVLCERSARHEGDCDDGTGRMWTHEDDCGCFDDALPT